MKDATVLTIVGVASITVLECFNMYMFKIDGAVLAAVVAVIAGMVGYNAKDLVAVRK